MPWYYDSRTGAAAEEAGVLGILSTLQTKFGLGWHEYATQADMLAAIKQNGWPAPNYNSTVSNPVGKTVVGAAESAASGGAGTSGGTACLISLPVVGCVLTKTQARALIAGILIGVSGIVGIVGLALLAIEASEKTGVGHAAGSALEVAGAGLAFVPGLEGAGLAVGAVGAGAKRAGSRSGASESLAQRRRGREYRANEAKQAAAKQQAETRRQAERERGTETTTVRERTPIDGQMGGTRDTTRTVRRPGPRPAESR